jgi:glycosyltransferase involved in cell wall biosynthesis
MNSTSLDNQDRKPRILYVAYPLLPVTENSAGGAEQVLWTLERELHARGHSTTVAASSGSKIAGVLFASGDPAESLDQFETRSEEQTRLVVEWLESGAAANFDLVHDMSGGFWQHENGIGLPVLATLHLPRSMYKHVDFSTVLEGVSFNCVSRSQIRQFNDLPQMLDVVPNGIALDRFSSELVPLREREYLLWLGRICEEKGTHIALDGAHAAGARLIIAGTVYPFLYHQKYFAREIIPRLKRAGNRAKYIERPAFAEKLDLIRHARALLITSEINETSSLVAMEAAACGTPVIALRRGALEEVIADGITGFLLEQSREIASALRRLNELDPEQCQRYAEEYYSASKMAEGYSKLYSRIGQNITNPTVDVRT